MKKLLRLCAIFALGLALTACSGDPEDHPIPDPQPSPEQPADPDDPNEPDLTEAQAVVARPDAWDDVRRGEMVYQLLVYSFADSDGDGIGDFRGIIDKLDYIADLGAAAIWLSPIHPADSYHGYDVTDYTQVNPDYGTEADLKALLDAAHQRGIKIYLDYVMNHTGKGHPWYADACSSVESEHRDWYIFSQNPDADVRAGKFPMIDPNRVEGSWVTTLPMSDNKPVRYKFVLDWSNASAPTVTVTETDEPLSAENTDTSVNYFIWYGDIDKAVRFHDKGDNRYELVIDYASAWGFLIRTSDTSWDGGTKWGAPSGAGSLVLGEPFRLDNKTPAGDIVFKGMEPWLVYSACYTDWMPDLNYGAIASFRESGPYQAIVESVKKWIDLGIDGLRLDMVKHIYSNPDSSENPTFWRGFYDDVNDYFRQSHDADIYMVGEVFSGVDQVVNYTDCGLSCFDFEFWGWGGEGKLSWGLKNGTGRYIAKDLIDVQSRLTAKNGGYVDATILSNHDMDRAAEAFGGNVDKCRMAGAILATLTGRPYVYYGEELAYKGTKAGGDEYVRAPMAWGDGYTTRYANKNWPSTATVAELTADTQSILNAYRTFGQLRNVYPALTEKGSIEPWNALYEGAGSKYDAVGAWYREAEGVRLLVLHNVGAAAVTLELTDTVEKAVAVWGEVKMQGQTLLLSGYSSVVFQVANN